MLILLFVMLATHGFSNHILGGNLTYECLGGNTYGITLTYYKDCFGATVEPDFELVTFEPDNPSCSNFTVNMDFVSVTEISDLCLSELVNNSCNGGFTPGTLEVIYYLEIDLDPTCIWTMSWQTGDWNYFINVDNSLLPATYFQETIDPSIPCEETPEVTSLGVPYTCTGDDVVHSFEIDNPGGYDLEYFFTPALTTGNVSVPYEAGFTFDEPIPGITLDNLTGEIAFTAPLTFGNYVVGIEVQMFDNGTYVGSFFEYMTFVVRQCGSLTEFNPDTILNPHPSMDLVSQSEVNVCLGDSLCFEVEASNTNIFRLVDITSNYDMTVFAGAEFVTELDNPATAEFCTEVTGAMVGTHLLEFYAVDDACEQESYDTIQVVVNVSPTVDLPFVDTLICADTELTIDVIGDTDFTWNVVLPDEDPGFVQGATSQTFTPEESMTIEIIANNAEDYCTANAFIDIEVSLYDIDTLITNESCLLNDGSINITPLGGSGNYDFSWDIPAATEDVTDLPGGTYSVTITDLDTDPQCSVTEIYDVEGVTIPSANIDGDVTICEGECHDITFNLTGDGPFTVQLVNTTTGITEATGALNDQDTFEVCPTETTTYELQLVSDSNVPACTDATVSSITVTVLPTVNATFAEPDDVCLGSVGELVINIDQAGTYDVTTNIGVFEATDGFVISDVDVPDAPTEFSITSVSYQGTLTCENTTVNTVDIDQIPLPTASLTGDTTICYLDLTAAFDLELTGTGPWLIDYQINANASATLEDLPVNDAISELGIGLTNGPVTQEYCIIQVTDTDTGCEQDVNACATVVVEELPTATYLGLPSYEICPGGSVGPIANILEPPFDADGNPYEFDIIMEILPASGGVIDSVIQNTNAFVLNLSPEETTTYNILNIVDSTGTAFCSSDINQSFDIIVYEIPETITPLDTVCDPPGENYTVTFEITGGNEVNYNVNGTFFDINGLGTLIGNTYTSEPIPSGFGETWTVDDGQPCPPIAWTISAYECPILTYSGTVDTTITSPGICEDGIYCIANQGDEVLDPNDVLSFAIVDNEDFSLANVLVLQDNNCFDLTAIGYPPLAYNEQYYGVVIAGNDDGGGLVDLNNPNISVSNADPFVIYETPTATVTGGAIVCEGDTATVQVQLTGSGPWDFEILLDGASDSLVTGFDEDIFFYEVTQGMDYTVTNLSNEYCATGLTDGTGVVLVNPIPTAAITADGSICDGEEYDFDLTFTGTPDFNVVLTFEDEDGELEDIVLPPDIPDLNTIFTATEAGSYYITEITDGNNCTSSDTTTAVLLTVFDAPTALPLFSDTSFCSGTVEELQVTFSGAPDFSLEYDFNGDPPVTEISTTDTITLNIGTAGDFNLLSVTDGNGCVTDLTDQGAIVITELETPVADAGPDVIVCSQVDQLVGTPDNPLFTYVWTGDVTIIDDDSIAQPTVNVVNDVEGVDDIYNLFMTVSNGQCEDSDDVVVTVEWEPLVEAGLDINLCNGDQTQLDGVGGVSCEWLPDPSFIDPLDICNPIVQPTDTTMYYLTVTGANGCLNSDSLTVFVPEVLDFELEFDGEVCFMTCDGFIDITPIGGYGDYTIQWSDLTLMNFTEEDLCAGVYDFTITDAQDCTVDGSAEIIELAEYVLDDVLITQPTCFDGNNGVIQVVSGTAVDYFIDFPDTNATGIFNNIEVGMYGVGAIDAFGCVANGMADVTSISDEISFNTSITDVVVCFEEPTDIEGIALGGNGAFTYDWYDCFPTPPCLIETAPITTITPVEDTQIWGVAIDGNGCSSDTLLVEINLAPEIFIEPVTEEELVICQGECVILEGIASGGDGAPILTWEVIDPSVILGTDPLYEECPLENTSFLATGSDGCSAPVTYQVDVTVNITPDVQFFIDGEDGCYPVTVEFQNLTDSDLLFECEWDFGDGNTQPICTEIEYTYALPGVYTPSLTVTTENGCAATSESDESVFVYDYPVVDFSWTPEYVSTINNEVQFINYTTNALIYNWDIGGIIQSNEVQPTVVLPDVDEIAYDICLEAISSQGCEAELCQSLFVNGELLAYVPSAFTPDFDGVNDVFKPVIRGVDPNKYMFRIYDRWNNIIFETTDIDGFWIGDNDLSNKEHYVDHDVYIYQIIVRKLSNDEEVEIVGHVTILR